MNERLLQDPDLAANDTAVVLVVDDEAGILAALKRLFRPVGYKVLNDKFP